MDEAMPFDMKLISGSDWHPVPLFILVFRGRILRSLFINNYYSIIEIMRGSQTRKSSGSWMDADQSFYNDLKDEESYSEIIEI